ncbi:MAG: DUF1302 domain-containing protein [Deltaproteobacteria bacterium]|nr:DUF1302 domain-containing protein [Deltaproteobacteria bacterium]
MPQRRSRPKAVSRLLLLGSLAATSLLLADPAGAFRLNTGNPDLKLSWDNTVKYSVAARVEGRADKLVADPNQDDGDRTFDRGLISNRFDLLSEFDAIYKKDFGIRLSGAAWYDLVYNRSTDNDSPGTYNPFSVSSDEFTRDTERLHGRKAELLDAFAFGKLEAGPTTTSVRVGQFAQIWGESLFFGNNGIAGGMAPIDVVKLLSVPNTQFKELIRPVPQVGAQLQLGPNVSVGAFYQFLWEKTRLPAAGSYFSTTDVLDEGGERILAGPNPIDPALPPLHFTRADDEEARDSGQGGIQVRFRPVSTVDVGLYAIRFHEKTPQVYVRPGQGVQPGPPLTGKVGEYLLVYPEDVQAYGASASTTFGAWNLATEVSMRRNTPLVSPPVVVPAGIPADNRDDPRYAVGNSVHAQISWLASFGPNFLSRESMFLGEVAWNRRTSVTDNSQALDPNADRDAWGFRMIFEPSYRQVLSGLDLSVPLGFAYFPKGKSSVVNSFGPHKGGDLTVGLNASYLDAWRFGLSYTHFYGPRGVALVTLPDNSQHFSYKQSLADRDFVSFTVRRTF